jgi:hypothetical protein
MLLADEYVGRIIFLRHDADTGVAEKPLEIGIELLDFLDVQDRAPVCSSIEEKVVHRK